MSFFESPQYMKGIQKIAAMNPQDKALNRALIDELSRRYADLDMRKQLDAMRQASIDKERERNLTIAGKRQEMGRNVYDFEKDQSDTAETLGWLNVGASGLRGYADMQNRKKLANQIKGLAAFYPR